jgi:hypothetical protein
MMFEPGQSGNPKGRPRKGCCLTEIVEKKLNQKVNGIKQRELIADKLIALAIGGDVPALKYLFDRIDGRPKETLKVYDGSMDTKLMEIINGR